jgi:GNAT superfamily N-acetyltransferase
LEGSPHKAFKQIIENILMRKIRAFKNIDEVACQKVIRRCLTDESSPIDGEVRLAILNELTSPDHFIDKSKKGDVFVCEEAGEIVAVCALEGNVGTRLYVDPAVQGKGIGSKMQKHLETLAIQHGHSELKGYAFKNAIEFYRKQGYVLGKIVIFRPPEYKGKRIPFDTIELTKKLK